jgi:hypothetical protein
LQAALTEEKKAREAQARLLEDVRLQAAELERARSMLAASTDEADKARRQADDLRQRLSAAAEELTRRRKSEEAALASLTAAGMESQELRVRHREIVEAFQRTYLSSLAPGMRGIEARKTAARARQMIERLSSLSRSAGSEPTRQLLDRLEAVLTRLDLMNVDRPESGDAFQRLIRQDDLEAKLDAALSAPGQTESLRNWLFEAKLILMGGPNAG